MEPLQKNVAVIVPIYNVEDYLSECLDSILSQTYTHFDIFAVDDASTDNSLQILLDYQKRDSRLIVLKRENNGGLSAARNTALEEIEKRGTYDYLCFCDSDDKISPHMIEELVNSIVSEKADIASCCFSRFNYQKKRSRQIHKILFILTRIFCRTNFLFRDMAAHQRQRRFRLSSAFRYTKNQRNSLLY